MEGAALFSALFLAHVWKLNRFSRSSCNFSYLDVTIPVDRFSPSHRACVAQQCVEQYDFDVVIEHLLGELKASSSTIRLIGMDCEWRPERSVPSKGDLAAKSRVACLQLAGNSSCLVLRTTWDDSQAGRVSTSHMDPPPSVRTFLEDRGIMKCGVDIRSDAIRLFRDFGIKTAGLLDLRTLFDAVMRGVEASQSRSSFLQSSTDASLLAEKGSNIGLRSLAKSCLGVELEKNAPVRCSDWQSYKLSNDQIEYAAVDAIVSPMIAHVLLALASGDPCCMNTAELLAKCVFEVDYEAEATKGVKGADKKNSINTNFSSDKSTASSRPEGTRKRRVEVRRQQLYDNCRIEAPDGQLLSTCSTRKVQWYVDRGLGQVISSGQDSSGEPPVLRLFFEPKGRNHADDVFYISDKLNICCVCGKRKDYLRHSVVPPQYRHFFPDEMKAHISHDVLLLCLDCHHKCAQLDHEMSVELSQRYKAPITGNFDRYERDPEVRAVRSSCMVLKRHRTVASTLVASPLSEESESMQPRPSGKSKATLLPTKVLTIHEEKVKTFFKTDELSDELIEEGCNLDPLREIPGWISHGQLVVDAVVTEYVASGQSASAEEFPHVKGELRAVVSALGAFVRQWRQRFLDKMKPKHLPTHWSVHNRIANSSSLSSS